MLLPAFQQWLVITHCHADQGLGLACLVHQADCHTWWRNCQALVKHKQTANPLIAPSLLQIVLDATLQCEQVVETLTPKVSGVDVAANACSHRYLSSLLKCLQSIL